MAEMGAVIVLFVTLAIITFTVILVVLEFRRVKKDIVNEEEVSRSNETTLNKNIKGATTAMSSQLNAQTTVLRNEMRTADSNINTAMTASQSNIYSTMFAADSNLFQSMSASDAKIQSDLAAGDATLTAAFAAGDKRVYDETIAYATQHSDSTYSNLSGRLLTLETGISTGITMIGEAATQIGSLLQTYMYPGPNSNEMMLRATAMNVGYNGTAGSGGSMAFSASNGVTFTNPSTDAAAFDMTAKRANIEHSLNLAGTLNFAANNASYMLGVDGTGIFLRGDKFSVRDAANNSRMTIDETRVSFNTNMNTTGDLTVNQAMRVRNTTTNGAYDMRMDGDDMLIAPNATLPTSTNVQVRDKNNTARLTVNSTGIAINGSTAASGDVSSTTRVCVKDVCLTDADISKLKASLSNASA